MSTNTLLLGGLLNIGIALASAPSIQLNAGTVHGTTCNGSDTSVYYGIPFAQPPVGNLRFMPPQALNGSFPNGSLNATQFTAECVQIPGTGFPWTLPSQSEDCLTLTVYVPPGNHSGLPVKVWAYGGSDTSGSASYPLYDLCYMATDSIGVAIQYRVGPLGFLALESAGIDGNQGIKDQIAALQWVQYNIAAFGGDPKKVMVFGQSSGADDVYAISTLPTAPSLMSSVICESGGGMDLPPKQTIENVGALYAAGLNCSGSDLNCLQSASVDSLVNTYLNLPVFLTGQGTLNGSLQNPALSELSVGDFPNGTDMSTPYLDGKLFTQQPNAAGPQVPIVLGSNTQDASLFVWPSLLDIGGSITANNYTEYLTQFGSQAQAVANKYPLSSFNSSGKTDAAVIAALTQIGTDWGFKCFTYRGLRAAANSGVKAYAYSFDHAPSCPWLWFNGAEFPTSGEDQFIAQPMHTAELPFVFGNLVNQPFGNGTCNATGAEQQLSATLRASWTAMAATGNPSLSNLSWTPFDECSSQGLYIGNSTTTIQTLDYSVCEFWDQVEQSYGGVGFSYPSNQSCENNKGPGAGSSSGKNSSDNSTGSANAHTSGQSGPLSASMGTLSFVSLVAVVFCALF